jgi:hypothetical protein
MERQTVPYYDWIVLDDGEVPTVCTMGQAYIRCPEYRGRGSLVSKVLRVIESALPKGDALAFIEDDDYYAPDYLEAQSKRLASCAVAGEGRAIYYNVAGRWWYAHQNMTHASLCQTVLRVEALPILLSVTRASEDPFIDVRLWGAAKECGKVFDPDGHPTLVGIKGMPGRSGYGCGHRHHAAAKQDPSLSHLKTLIGNDASFYEPFYNPTEKRPSTRTELAQVARPPIWKARSGH